MTIISRNIGTSHHCQASQETIPVLCIHVIKVQAVPITTLLHSRFYKDDSPPARVPKEMSVVTNYRCTAERRDGITEERGEEEERGEVEAQNHLPSVYKVLHTTYACHYTITILPNYWLYYTITILPNYWLYYTITILPNYWL